jgi:predicted transcriptional regulator
MRYNIIQASEVLEDPSFQGVLEIAKGIIDKNKVLSTELLYSIAKKKLNIPRKGLLSIIQTLLNRKILVEGSKYTKDTVMKNPFRRMLYDFIKENKGTHFSLIRKQINFDDKGKIASPGRLIWHLEMLLKFNFIKKVKYKNYTLFLPLNIGEEEGIFHFLLRDEINLKIIKKVFELELIRGADLYKEIHEKRELVYYRVKNLIDHELLSIEEENNENVIINLKSCNLLKKILPKS